MVTKTALIGLAHFLMQADPQITQNVLNQLPVEDSQQVMQLIETGSEELPTSFVQKLDSGLGKNQNALPAPSLETTQGYE